MPDAFSLLLTIWLAVLAMALPRRYGVGEGVSGAMAANLCSILTGPLARRAAGLGANGDAR